MKDNLHTGDVTREKLVSGIRKCADAVGGTMGTGGFNALIECMENPQHFTTNDGATILESIHFSDEIEEIGRRVLLEAVKRANKQSGDGSSTTTVLTAAIIEEGMKYLDKYSPMDIKKSLDECVAVVEESIKKQKREITVDTVGQVASISAEDEKIGALIQEIYQKIGKDGIIHWDISKSYEDEYSIGEGITIDGAALLSPYMADMDTTGNFLYTTRLKNPKILVTKQKLSSLEDISHLMESLYKNDIKELVVFADEVDPLVIGSAAKTRFREQNAFRVLIVKMPTIWKDWWYEDIAKATGAAVVDGVNITNRTAKKDNLGTVENLSVTKSETHLDGIKDVSEHVKQLEEENTDDSKLRASRLNTKTARYFVGAPSETALAYRRLKVEDAISAAWQALQNGVVAGGGSSLVQAAHELPGGIGGLIMAAALKAPAKQIASNSGHKKMVIGAEYLEGKGFDSRTGTFVDMFDAGIIDPANVVLNAVRNSISVAASVLTAPVVITLPRQEQQVSQRN